MLRKTVWLGGGSLAALIAWTPIVAAASPDGSTLVQTPAAVSQPALDSPKAVEAVHTPPTIVRPSSDASGAAATPIQPADAGSPSAAPSSSPPANGIEPQPAASTAAAPPPSPLQQAVAAFVAGGGGRSTVEARRRREAVAAFYAARAYKPLWIANDSWTGDAKAVVERLRQADADGLSPAALGIPELSAGDPAAMAAVELALSDSVALFGEEASGGRVDFHKIVAQIDDPHARLQPNEILTRVAAASNPAETLDAFDPPQPGFKALRARLAELRAGHPESAAVDLRIPGGRTLHTGMRDPRAPLLRKRLSLVPATGADADLYDGELAAAVADFQRSAGLPADGALTPRTVAALSRGADASSGGVSGQEAEIVANMELWRWSPRDMGADRIEVNIPDFSLTLYRDDKAVRHSRVVVGKATNPTPLFSNIVRYAVVNPSWAVPQSIVKKEMLPKYAANPNYFAQNGYVVTRKGSTLEVRQPPGDRNALGRIKFLFPNDYDVYLHDTPERALFGDAVRDFSHGCIRVQDPFALGQDILGADWSEDRLKKLIGVTERTIRVPAPLPIHIEYFTAWIDDAGKLETRPDVYGYTRKIERALGYVG